MGCRHPSDEEGLYLVAGENPNESGKLGHEIAR
jgi:hypothetical protein